MSREETARRVEEVLERMEDEGLRALEEVCARYPEVADSVRRRVQGLIDLGLLEVGEGADGAEAFPERLHEFRLLRPLGRGGMGVVYLAEQQPLGRRVALKLVRPDQLYFGESRERFRREAESIARLHHPGIVSVHTFGESEGIPYFAMEYVEGASLGQALEELKGRRVEELEGADLYRVVLRCAGREVHGETAAAPALFDGGWVPTCLRIARALAEALEHAHTHEVLHRDVKPANAMLTPEGRVRLLDFGLASWSEGSELTRTGTQLGSMAYMAPEQLRDASRVDRRVDVYALGVTLYELLTLRAPFVDEDDEGARRRILAGDAPPVCQLNRSVPPDVATVCWTAMETEPDRRYASAGAFARDLANLLEFRPIDARRPGSWQRLRRHAQRHPTRAVVGALAVLLLLLASPLYASVQKRTRDEVEATRAREASLHASLSAVREQRRATLQRVEHERQRAEARLREIVRLADLERLLELEEEAKTLWPARRHNGDALQGWLGRARALLERREDHAETLRRLEDGSFLPMDGSFLPVDGGEDAFSVGDVRWWTERLHELARTHARFLDPDPWVGRVADVESRLRRARSIRQQTVDAHLEAWEAAAEAVFLDDRFEMFELEPQVGLVPLGPDPESGLWEFWHVESGARPPQDARTSSWGVDAESGMVLCLIPGGETWIGAQSTDPEGRNHDPDARDGWNVVHEVLLDPYLISKFEMTQAQWRRITGHNPSWYNDEHPSTGERAPVFPVEQISWFDAEEVLRRVGLVLPTEAQWERAARAGTQWPWWTGPEPSSLEGSVNLQDRSHVAEFAEVSQGEDWDDGWPGTAPVGTYAPNPFGLYDVLGNVSEWCRDPILYGEQRVMQAGSGAVTTPAVPGQGRAIRGSNYYGVTSWVRIGRRGHNEPEFRTHGLGCRPAMELRR